MAEIVLGFIAAIVVQALFIAWLWKRLERSSLENPLSPEDQEMLRRIAHRRQREAS